MTDETRPPIGGQAAPHMPARLAELTYSSFDTGAGGGGWQVKQVHGQLKSEEIDRLCAQIGTHLDPGLELPRFPTPEELAGFPRRLVYAPAGSPDDRSQP